jgi:FkbM family methyltransferase
LEIFQQHRIRAFTRLARAFGWGCALTFVVQRLLRRKLLRVRLKALETDLWLRAGSSDFKTFLQVFAGDECQMECGFAPHVIVDCGANIGLVSVAFARAWPSAHIIALEPDQGNFDVLKLNCRGYPNIHPICSALWSRGTRLVLTTPGAEFWSLQYAEGDTSTAPTVTGITIPSLMKVAGLTQIDLLKMDIEGAELDVFAHDCSWLENVRLLLIEVHSSQGAVLVRRVMSNSGFKELPSSGEKLFFARVT